MTGPKINEEMQRLIEPAEFHLPTTASLPKRRLSPHSFTALKSPSKDKDRLITTPKASAQTTSAHQQPDRNTLEESLKAALSQPHTATHDGRFDDEYGERTPLLSSCYNKHAHHKLAKPHFYKPSRNAPLEPARKSKASRSICLWHELSHSSQYTRPAAEMLREVLEERYPPVSPVAQQSVEAGEQAGGDRRRWWKRIMMSRHPTT